MTLLEAIKERHSVRKYTGQEIEKEKVIALQQEIETINREGQLNAQLILNEPKAFKGIFAYGKFYNVNDYIVMIGKDAKDLNKRVGYYGERLVLFAQTLGLNTCWVGLSYHKVPNTYVLNKGEKVACYISIGYGENQGHERKSKSLQTLGGVSEKSPLWYKQAIEAVSLAPTAINQQKFTFEYQEPQGDSKPIILARKGFSLVGYTEMDFGIAKLHFELAAQGNDYIFREE